jgi:hypothetical protein
LHKKKLVPEKNSCSGVVEEHIFLQLFKKYPEFYAIRSFITVFTKARHLPLSWATSIQSTPPPINYSIFQNSSPFPIAYIFPKDQSPRPCEIFRNMLSFTVMSFQHLAQTPKLRNYPLSAVFDCLFNNIFTAIPRIWRPSLPSATWGYNTDN